MLIIFITIIHCLLLLLIRTFFFVSSSPSSFYYFSHDSSSANTRPTRLFIFFFWGGGLFVSLVLILCSVMHAGIVFLLIESVLCLVFLTHLHLFQSSAFSSSHFYFSSSFSSSSSSVFNIFRRIFLYHLLVQLVSTRLRVKPPNSKKGFMRQIVVPLSCDPFPP